MWSKYLSNNMYGEALDFQCQHQQWYHEIPNRKINFAVNLRLKLFPAAVANADIGGLKSLHTFLQKRLYHMLVKSEQNRMVQTTRKFELFDKKPGFLKNIFDKALTPLWNTFL